MNKIYKYYKPYIVFVLMAFALLFVQAMCELSLPDYMSDIVANGIATGDTGYIIEKGLIMLLVSFLSASASICTGFLASRVAAGVARDTRRGVFNRVMDYSNAQFDNFSVSTLITRSTNDITQVQMVTVFLIRMVFYAPVMGIGGAVKAVNNSANMPGLAWVIIGAVAFVLVFIVILLSIVQPKFMVVQKMTDRLNLIAREGLTGTMVVRAFINEEKEEAKFDEENTKITKLNLFLNRIMALMMPTMMLVMNSVSMIVVWVASYSAANVADVGNMMAFIQYATQIIISFVMVSVVFVMLPRAFVSVKRINEILTKEPSIKNKENAIEKEKFDGSVEFKNVFFKYPDAEDYVLKNISFSIKRGETVGFVGSTGSGKSTLIHLIPRLYDVSEGNILVDGVDIRDINVENLRKNIGFVPQKSVLFKGTIAENLKYGNDEATDEEMKKAAEIAQAAGFIAQKENGYEYDIAQGGSNVSGGQRQRLSIARALAKDAPIYIFDDSFSALDFKTDAALRQALKDNTQDKTLLIVSSRIGTIMHADKIIVLNEGEMAGMGTHEELMKSCEVYAQIARSQLSQEEAAI